MEQVTMAITLVRRNRWFSPLGTVSSLVMLIGYGEIICRG